MADFAWYVTPHKSDAKGSNEYKAGCGIVDSALVILFCWAIVEDD